MDTMYHIMVESGLNRLKIALNDKLWNIVIAATADAGTLSSISAQIYRQTGSRIWRTLIQEKTTDSLLINSLLCVSFSFLYLFLFFREYERPFFSFFFLFCFFKQFLSCSVFISDFYDILQDSLKNINIFFIRVTQCRTIALILMRGSVNRSPVKF